MAASAIAVLPIALIAIVVVAGGQPRTGNSAPGASGASPTPRATWTPIPGKLVSASCAAQVKPFELALVEVQGQATTSTTIATYTKAVAAADTARSRVKTAGFDPACISLFAAAQTVLGSYQQAENTWHDCLGTTGCTVQSIEPALRQDWQSAAAGLANIRQSLP